MKMEKKMQQMMRSSMKWIVALLILVMAGSCSDEDTMSTMNGRLRLLLTDAPLPMDTVESAWVTLEKIELRRAGDDDDMDDDPDDGNDDDNGDDSSGENGDDSGDGDDDGDDDADQDDDGENGDDDDDGDEDGNPFITVMEETKEFNLAALTNGLTEELAFLDIPAGSYDLVRLYISDARVKIKEGGEYDLKIPSGASSGLKIFIKPPLTVEGGITEELLLDFDLSRSLIPKGNWDNLQGFNFKPVVRAVNVSSSGRIEGNVTDEEGQPLAGVEVWIEADGEIVSTTFSEETGFYALIGVPADDYELYAGEEGFESFEEDDVEVTAGNKTTLDIVLTAEADDE